MDILQEGYDQREFCSVKEAAEFLGVSTKTVRNRIAAKTLPAGWNEIGRGKSQWLIKRSDLEAAKAAEGAIVEAVKRGEVAASSHRRPAQLELFKAIMKQENDTLREELQAIRQSQERLERLLIEKDEQLRALIEERKKPWWKVW